MSRRPTLLRAFYLIRGGQVSWRQARLSPPERRLWRAAANGESLDLHDDSGLEPHRDNRRTIRAGVLRRLLTDRQSSNSYAIRLRGARISGAFDVEAVALTRGLYMTDCLFDQPVNLTDSEVPSVRLHGCNMPGLNADRLSTRGNLEIGNGFQAGWVRLKEAHIGGSLLCDGAQLHNPGGKSFDAWGIHVDQSMHCGNGFTTRGQISLGNAYVGGVLAFTGAKLYAPDDWALNAQSIKVGYALFLGSSYGNKTGFTAHGGIRLVGARIDGFMCCWGAKFFNPEGYALAALGLYVRDNVLLNRGFTATGQVDLNAAHIGSRLDLDGAALSNPGQIVLSAERMHVGKYLMLRDGFTARGAISFTNTRVDGSLDFTNSRLDTCHSLSVTYLQAQSLIMRHETPPASADFRHARVAVFADDPLKWPSKVRLWNFTYGQLDDMTSVSVRQRLKWLYRDSGGYLPQPYEQLAQTYRRAGHEQAARQTAIAKLWHQRSTLNSAGKAWNWLLYLTVGYGYRTWLAGLWLLALLVIGGQIFDRAYPATITPTEQLTSTFNPYVYAADVLIPVLDLGQQSAWQLSGAVAYWSWSLAAAGWILTTAVIAGLTRVFKRE